MKVRKLIGTVFVGGLLLASIIPTAYAAESNANITFIGGTGAPDVLDPDNPQNPFDPGNPPGDGYPDDTVTGNTGPLTLDYVSSFDFGSQAIESTAETYNSTTLRPFIQVSDRRGTGDGWQVRAQMSSFTNDGELSLQGASLILSDGSAISPGTGGAPTVIETINLISGGEAATVVTADIDQGLGSWLTRWFPTVDESGLNDNVTLEVPAGTATLGEHVADITWTLYDAPSGGQVIPDNAP